MQEGSQTNVIPQSLLEADFDSSLDSLTAMAVKILKVPIALISLVERHRQFFKSHCGLPEDVAAARETPLSHSFCQYVVATAEDLVVNDAVNHPLVRENLAIRDLGVAAYLGTPLLNPEGLPIGAFCVIDTRPRDWTPEERELAHAFAAQVMSEVALRIANRQQREELAFMKAAEEERSRAMLADRHDLRTPMNALLLSLQAIEILGDLNGEQRECLRMAERNGVAVIAMVNQMLSSGLAGNQTMELTKQPVAPEEILREAVEQMKALASSREQTISLLAGSVPLVAVDQEKMVRVLVNLLANASKFSPKGSAIVAGVESIIEGPGPATMFTVRDNGPGIPGEFAEKIFEEGFRIDAAADIRNSSGLGLPFCRRAVEAHGGRLWLEQTLDGGSIFRFTVPG